MEAKDEGSLDYDGVGRDGDQQFSPFSYYLVSYPWNTSSAFTQGNGVVNFDKPSIRL